MAKELVVQRGEIRLAPFFSFAMGLSRLRNGRATRSHKGDISSTGEGGYQKHIRQLISIIIIDHRSHLLLICCTFVVRRSTFLRCSRRSVNILKGVSRRDYVDNEALEDVVLVLMNVAFILGGASAVLQSISVHQRCLRRGITSPTCLTRAGAPISGISAVLLVPMHCLHDTLWLVLH